MKLLRTLALLALFPLVATAQAPPPKPTDSKPVEVKKGEPKKDEPKKEEPKKQEPKKEEPKKDEPKKDEPKKDEPKKPEKYAPVPGFKTVAELAKADPKQFKEDAPARAFTPGFIGIDFAESAKPTVADVMPGSPAEKDGLKVGDVITKVGDAQVLSLHSAKERLRGLVADEKTNFTVERVGKAMVIAVTPKATSKPFAAPTGPTGQAGARAMLGVRVGDAGKDGGLIVDTLTGGGAAEKAGIKEKDVLLQIDGKKVEPPNNLTDLLADKKPGDTVTVKFSRDGKEQEAKATLAGDGPGGPGGGRPGFGGAGGGWNDSIPSAWKRKDYKLAVIGIDYPDQKHNEKTTDKDWEESLFSVGKYTGKSATGQNVFGSMADYYKEISYNDLKVEGSFVGWHEVSKKRLEYSSGSGTSTREKSALLTEAMDKVLEKKGKDSLKDYDGVFFLFAGGSVPNVTRGSLYWPHRASFRHNNKSWPYFIVQEGGERMTNISVFCHEFGHMLGLPDLYARPEVPGMEGLGQWCAMSNQIGNGRPQHFSAWSKMQLGWAKPTMIDPRVKQKVVLSPIEDDQTQCVKVPLRTDGSEYLLLENRRKKGFDSELPAEGLLIWRVLPGERGSQPVYLEESHGIEGVRGPSSFTGAVPFPSPANDSFTPYTTPSSKAKRGGGLDVFITNITRLPDGRVTFCIGYEYQ